MVLLARHLTRDFRGARPELVFEHLAAIDGGNRSQNCSSGSAVGRRHGIHRGMDETLESAWRSETCPFDGLTLRVADVPVSSLAPLLTELVAGLRLRLGAGQLWRVEDWHAHDGWVKERRSSSWAELVELCRSPEALIASAALDDHVALALYTEPLALLLRIEVEEFPEPGRERLGAFDVTLPNSAVQFLDRALRERVVERSPAKAYFDQIYAG